jgi:hypothetical protein
MKEAGIRFPADWGPVVDIETRRKKQQALMVQAIERKVRSRARQIYESAGQAEGKDLENWFQAESEVLENSSVAPLYRRVKQTGQPSTEPSSNETEDKSAACETSV